MKEDQGESVVCEAYNKDEGKFRYASRTYNQTEAKTVEFLTKISVKLLTRQKSDFFEYVLANLPQSNLERQ